MIFKKKPTQEQKENAIKGYELAKQEIQNSNLKEDMKEFLISLMDNYIKMVKDGRI